MPWRKRHNFTFGRLTTAPHPDGEAQRVLGYRLRRELLGPLTPINVEIPSTEAIK